MENDISKPAVENLARILLPEIQKFYESDEGKQLFEQWKAERNQSNKEKSKVKP